MRALVIGASGLVGGALMRVPGIEVIGTYRSRPGPGLVHLDADSAREVSAAVARSGPDVIFIPAAEPNVEWCELHPSEARERNVRPVEVTLRVARERPIVAYSTDYVFDGAAGPYDESAVARPLSVYGRVKRELEELLLDAGQTIVRTTTVFGVEHGLPKNFVLRLVAALRRGEQVAVPSDQVSTPTFADDLATASVRIATTAPGLWHVAGPDVLARSELARMAADAFELPAELVRPVATATLGQAAPRPLRGGLIAARYTALYGPPCRPTVDALRALRTAVGLRQRPA